MNYQIKLKRNPTSRIPNIEDDFVYQHDGLVPKPENGQALVRTIYLSLDPYQWYRRMNGVEKIGDVCHGRTVCQVVESKMKEYNKGDYVFCTNGWQEYGLIGRGISNFNYMFPRKLDINIAPISTAIGITGMLGLTAYSGMILQCQPKAGETVVVSASSGGVGQCAVQMAKIFGCRVVGIAGEKKKVDFVKTLIDDCVSYKSSTFAMDLKNACPNGIDCYFENVGGDVFAAVLPLLNENSRISLCGLISRMNNDDAPDNAHKEWFQQGNSTFKSKNVTPHRLFVGDYVQSHQDEFLNKMASWIKEGKINYKEDIYRGLENAPKIYKNMMIGGTFGKTLIQVGPDPTKSASNL